MGQGLQLMTEISYEFNAKLPSVSRIYSNLPFAQDLLSIMALMQ